MVSKETSVGVKVREKSTRHISVEERGDVELCLFAVTCHFLQHDVQCMRTLTLKVCPEQWAVAWEHFFFHQMRQRIFPIRLSLSSSFH